MGSGRWTPDAYVSYANSTGRSVSNTTYTNATTGITTNYCTLDSSYGIQDTFKSRKIDPKLDPKDITRECCDNEEHPETIPVILALDVTGSMGSGATECAKKLNIVMSELFKEVNDVEFMIMAIGDLSYDRAPIQISQFESDIRVAEWLDKVYFEGHGGGNDFESYTAAWYMGLYHTKLDCWKRNKKGIIITLGDELLNPYLPKENLSFKTGDKLQGDIETDDLYKKASEKFDIYHLAIDDNSTSYKRYKGFLEDSWRKYLDENHFKVVKINELVDSIISIVKNADCDMFNSGGVNLVNGEIAW